MTRDSKSTELNPLSFLKRELSKEERTQRALEINDYLLSKGGIIVAVSCEDGILLTGVSPDGDSTIFDVFDRIGLLGIGSTRDCEAIHSLAAGEAHSTMLMPSKADIDSRDIAKQISNGLDECFRYLGGQRGAYEANFIIAELGFDVEEDFIEFINFSGGNKILNVPRRKFWKIYEVPTVLTYIVPEEYLKEVLGLIQANDKKGLKKVLSLIQENSEKKKKDDKKEKLYEVRKYEVPAIDAFNYLFNSLYSNGSIPTVQETALFTGLLVRFFNQRGGRLEMAYLDRNMLKKSKTEERRFHYVLNWITNPNPHKSFEPWREWEKFVAPVYRKVKKEELYLEQKYLIELYEIFKKEKFDPKELFEKLQKEEMFKLMSELLGKKRQESQQKNKT